MSVTLIPPLRRDRVMHAYAVARMVSEAGDQLWAIALSWTAVHVATPAVAGLVVAAGTIPRALVVLVGGALADRLPTRRIMVATDAGRVVVLLAVVAWALTWGPAVPGLLVAAVCFGVFDALYRPASGTLPRQMLRPEELTTYVGAWQTLARIGNMLGLGLGGFLVAAAGLAGSAAVDAVSFAVILVLVLGWVHPRHEVPRASGTPVLTGIREGFAHLRAEPVTRILVLALSGLNLFVAPAETIGLALSVQAHGWGAGVFGGLGAAIGLGAAAGSLLGVTVRPRRPALAGFLQLVVQGCLIACLAAPWLPVLFVAAAALGVTAGLASVWLAGLFVEVVDESYLGRMSSIQSLADDLAMPVSTALFGLLATTTSLTVAFATYGGGMVLYSSWPLTRSAVRELTGRRSRACAS